jgi:hypothetical protein
MGNGLAMIQTKLDRADEHLKALHGELRTLINTEGKRIYAPIEFDADTGWHISKIGEFSKANTRISILAGEICYQLLSVLEHIIVQVIEANGEKACRHCNRFPIMRKPPPSDETFLEVTEGSSLKNVPITAIKIIEQFQPYKTRDLSLHFVKLFADIDKHRFLLTWIISMSNPEEIQSLYVLDPPGPIEEIRVSVKSGQRLEAGTELARVRLPADNREGKVYMKGRLATRIDICEIPGAPAAPSLDAMRFQVGTVVNELEPFLL